MSLTKLPQGLRTSRVDGTKKRIHPLKSLETATYETGSMADVSKSTSADSRGSDFQLRKCGSLQRHRNQTTIGFEHTRSIVGVLCPVLVTQISGTCDSIITGQLDFPGGLFRASPESNYRRILLHSWSRQCPSPAPNLESPIRRQFMNREGPIVKLA